MPSKESDAGLSLGRLVKFMGLLWLAGIAMRMTLLAMPPVIPLVHDELHMSETQVGLLIGLPLAIFAAAAVPGSLLIARIGTGLAVLLGMVITAVASGARGAAVGVGTLYAATIAMGFGIAIMQPGLPTLVREWAPNRIALGTLAYSAGMVVGATLPPALTFSFVLPLIGGGWRGDLIFWAVPTILIVPVFFFLSPKRDEHHDGILAIGGRWWPQWNSPLLWLLGLTFASNTAPFYSANAFIGDYLTNAGKADLLSWALGWLNGAQIFAFVVLFVLSSRLQRRPWPFLVFGPIMLVGFVCLMLQPSPFWIVFGASCIGIATAITMTALLALPPVLSAPADLSRTAAGMFTISYSCAIIIPTFSGALWDFTGKPWTTFVPSSLCAVALTVMGAFLVRFPPAGEAGEDR